MRIFPKRAANSAAAHGSRRIRLQPNYHTEISDEYLEKMQEDIDAKKPENFSLTPLSEAGW